MKTLLCSVALFAAASTACGTAVASTSTIAEERAARSFDPIAAYPQARAAAGAITRNVSAIALTATRSAQAPNDSTRSASFTWVWTVVGDDGVFVDVAVSPQGVKVLGHESRMILADQALFEPGKLRVTGAEVLALAMRQQAGQPTDLYLTSTMLEAGGTQQRWSVGFSDGEVTVDGDSGAIVQ